MTVRLVKPNERRPGEPTPGLVREQAFSTDGMWSGIARTQPGMTSGWHHHGENDTTIYVISGTIRLEFGAGGGELVEGRPGDFVLVPRGVVHRESNPSDAESEVVIVRAGSGPPTINVDGPTTG